MQPSTGTLSRNIVLYALVVITLACAVPQAGAAVEWRGLSIDVTVYTDIGLSTYRALPQGRHTFTATWDIDTGGPSGEVDLYFGLLGPDGKSVYTWKLQDGGGILGSGWHPIAQGIKLGTPATYHSQDLAGNLRYTLTGREAPGMYLVLALVTGAGKDPSDPANWVEVEMKPFFVR